MLIILNIGKSTHLPHMISLIPPKCSQTLTGLFTHPSICIIALFWLIKVLRALLGVPLVIISARLLFLLIQRILQISQRSYNYRKAIISIISLFSFIVPSLIRHSYNEKESIHTTVGIFSSPSLLVIILRVVPIAYAISTPYTILYSSEASALRIIRLLFVEL